MLVFHPRVLNLERPPNTKPIVAGVFRSVNCLTCGKCCKGIDRLPVHSREPHAERIRIEIQKRSPARLEEQGRNGFHIINDDRTCAFLNTTDNACRVYSFRPNACHIYPFTVRELKTEGRERGIRTMVLHTHCPPLKELKERGVGYLLISDIVDVSEQEHPGEGKALERDYSLPLLGPALLGLEDALQGGFLSGVSLTLLPETHEPFFLLW